MRYSDSMVRVMIRQCSDKEQLIDRASEFGDLNKTGMDENGYQTSYLAMAIEENNLEAVKAFLEMGADPNYYDSNLESCLLWDLQYLWQAENRETRYQISKEF